MTSLKLPEWLYKVIMFLQKDILLKNASSKAFYNTNKYTFERLLDDYDHIEDNFRDYLNGFSGNVREIIEKLRFHGHITNIEGKWLNEDTSIRNK